MVKDMRFGQIDLVFGISVYKAKVIKTGYRGFSHVLQYYSSMMYNEDADNVVQ